MLIVANIKMMQAYTRYRAPMNIQLDEVYMLITIIFAIHDEEFSIVIHNLIRYSLMNI